MIHGSKIILKLQLIHSLNKQIKFGAVIGEQIYAEQYLLQQISLSNMRIMKLSNNFLLLLLMVHQALLCNFGLVLVIKTFNLGDLGNYNIFF